MSMEAYQKLDREIDTQCCNAIQIAISTVDRYPGTVTLELELLDTQSPNQAKLSLGSMEVTARPHSAPQLGHRDPLRLETSARISIDRFLLLPRT